MRYDWSKMFLLRGEMSKVFATYLGLRLSVCGMIPHSSLPTLPPFSCGGNSICRSDETSPFPSQTLALLRPLSPRFPFPIFREFIERESKRGGCFSSGKKTSYFPIETEKTHRKFKNIMIRRFGVKKGQSRSRFMF